MFLYTLHMSDSSLCFPVTSLIHGGEWFVLNILLCVLLSGFNCRGMFWTPARVSSKALLKLWSSQVINCLFSVYLLHRLIFHRNYNSKLEFRVFPSLNCPQLLKAHISSGIRKLGFCTTCSHAFYPFEKILWVGLWRVEMLTCSPYLHVGKLQGRKTNFHLPGVDKLYGHRGFVFGWLLLAVVALLLHSEQTWFCSQILSSVCV